MQSASVGPHWSVTTLGYTGRLACKISWEGADRPGAGLQIGDNCQDSRLCLQKEACQILVGLEEK